MHLRSLFNYLCFACFLFASLPIVAQSGVTTTCFQPGSTDGQDATVWSLDPTQPNAVDWSLLSNAWTWQGQPGTCRGFLKFDGLAGLPAGAHVTQATLKLSFDPISAYWASHSQLSGSNTSVLLRVTAPWHASAVTWNTQPSTRPITSILAMDMAILPANTTPNQDYTLDLTDMVRYWHQHPGQNHGVMLRLLREEYYRVMIFASSEHPNSALRPQLCVSYTLDAPVPDLCLESEQVADAVIRSAQATTNFGLSPDNVAFSQAVPGGVDTMRSLLTFADLATIPPHTQVLQATVKLFNHPASSLNAGQHANAAGSNAARYLRVLQPWSESAVNWANQPPSAPINAPLTTDYGLLPASTSANEDYQIDITDMVQFWIDNPALNHGGMLHLEDEGATRGLVFASRDQGNPALYPQLCLILADTLADTLNLNDTVSVAIVPQHQPERFQVVPQPAVGDFSVRFEMAVPGRQLSLWNLQGQLLLQQHAEDVAVVVARGGLPAGVYLLRVDVPDQAPECKKVRLE